MRLTYLSGLLIFLLVGLAVGYYTALITSVTPSYESLESVVVVDSLGRYVRVGNYSRVISLAPSITEIVFALGLEDYLVGVDDFSNYPGKLLDMISSGKIRYVGGWWLPDVERVIALRPSLVLADSGVYRQVVLESKFKELGINTLYLRGSSCRDVFDIISDIKLVGMVFNVSSKADELTSSIIGKVSNISNSLLSMPTGRPKVLFLAGLPSEGLYSAGGNTYIGYVIEVSGGINIVREFSGWPLLSYEKILSENPDVLLIATVGGDVEKVREELSKTPLADTNAFKNGRVYLLVGEAGDVLVRPGPRVYMAVDIISKILHPDVFGTANMSGVYKVLS